MVDSVIKLEIDLKKKVAICVFSTWKLLKQ